MASLSDSALTAFVVFCRIGACLMLVPGYSSGQVPMQVRLFIAIAVTLALTPLLSAMIVPLVSGASPLSLFALIWSELVVGAVIGLAGRVFYLALQTMATGMAMAIGLSTIPGTPIDEIDPVPALVPMITISATLLFFVTDQHWEVLRGLASSYRIWQPAEGLRGEIALLEVTGRLSEAFVVALRVTSPFIVYAVVVNLAIGLANKLTPTIPIFFISVPFVLAGGLLLFYLVGAEMLMEFTSSFAARFAE